LIKAQVPPRKCLRFRLALDGITFQQESIKPNIGIKVFPNPASESFIVKLDNFSGQAKVNLRNSFGVVLKKRGFYIDGNSYQFEFDLAGLQGGIYYLSVECENIQEIRKVIVY
jgi:hypothetical protein